MREPEDPELDPEMIAPYEDQITTRDVTPDDFGRIAAQTAKQVILQRIREAERQMMFDEYQDRVGELITGIIQQSDKRYTLVQLRERVEALLPQSEQVYNERYDHGMRVKAVITDVSDSTKGPGDRRLAAQPGADQEAVRARGPRDRRQAGRDRRRRPRARLPLEDRRHLARRRRRPGRRLRRPARLAGADGRLRAARREDRHHPPQRRARPLRRQGALAGPRPRGARRRRGAAGDRDRPRRPALAGDRPRRPERPPRRPPHRLAGRHQVRDRVRQEDEESSTRSEERPTAAALAVLSDGRRCPNAVAPRLALLRPAAAPGAGPLRDQPGGGALRRSPRPRSRSSPTPTRRRGPGRRDRRQRAEAAFEEQPGEEEPPRPDGRGGGCEEVPRSRPRPTSEEADARSSRRPRRQAAEEPSRSRG